MAVSRAQSGNLFGEGNKLKKDDFASRQMFAIIAADDLLRCYKMLSALPFDKERVESEMRTTIYRVLRYGSVRPSYAQVVNTGPA